MLDLKAVKDVNYREKNRLDDGYICQVTSIMHKSTNRAYILTRSEGLYIITGLFNYRLCDYTAHMDIYIKMIPINIF